MRRLLATFALLLCSSLAWATVRTSNTSTTGNLSDGTKWVGGVAPSCAGTDAIVVASGATITIDSGAALAGTLTLTQVAVGTYSGGILPVTYSYSSYSGVIPVPGTALTFSGFANAGNNVVAPLVTISGGASGTLTINYPTNYSDFGIWPVNETHAGSAAGSYCALGASTPATTSYVTAVANPSGTSFSGACTVAFSGGGGGIGATATCSISGGSISTTLTYGGNWYTSAPTATYTCTGCSSTTSPSVTMSATGTAAAMVTGVLKTATGVTFVARGDVTNNLASGSGASWFVLNVGSAFAFDSSNAASPTTTRYSMQNSASNAQYRAFDSTACTASPFCVVTSVMNNGALAGVTTAYGAPAGFASGNAFKATYTAFSFIGDALVPFSTIGDNDVVPWIATYSTFDNCGVAGFANGGNLGTNEVVQHNHNVHTNSLGSSPFWLTSPTALGTGAREVLGNVFDKAPAGTASVAAWKGVTISGNYLNRGISLTPAVVAGFSNNLWRMGNVSTDTGNLSNSISSSYIYLDTDTTSNPHYFANSTGTGNFVLNKIIVGTSGTASGDSGEWLVGPIANGSSYSITNSVQMCDPSGVGSSELISTEGTTTGTWTLTHNTICGGYGAAGAVQLMESGLTAAGIVTFQDNLVFNLSPAAWFKLECTGSSCTNGTMTADVCASSAACDYNGSFNLTPKTQASCTSCTNQAKSYAAKWTAQTPGAHDVDDQSPAFLASGWASNHFQKVENFDRLYLGPKSLISSGQASPSAWASGTYSLNAFVSHSYSTMYNSETFNFRCIVASCTLEPGVPGTSWRSQWEWASLYQLRILTAAQTLITDATIGCGSGCSAIQALNAWTLAGLAPTNALFKGKAHDGSDIGAVPVVLLSSPRQRAGWSW